MTSQDLKIPEGRLAVVPIVTVLGLFGQQNSAKSACMAYFGVDAVKMDMPVWYWPKAYGFKYGEGLSTEELMSLPERVRRGRLLIDEIQVLLNKYRSATTASAMMMAFFQQVRKRSCDVVFTSNAPDEIQQALPDQTTFHAFCERVEDSRCRAKGYHLKECQDYAILRWVDTRGANGFARTTRDGRKRFPGFIYPLVDLYPTYDTYGTADITDVMAIDKKTVMQSRAEQELGMTFAELQALLRDEVIPALVQQGVDVIVPANFAVVLERERSVKLSAEQLGRQLGKLGLPGKHTNKGTRYTLPPDMTALQLWQDGVWTPED